MFPTGKLVPIPRADWPQLRDLLKGNDLVNEIPFNSVQNYIKWTAIDPKIRHLEILSLNDSWRQNGTFIISFQLRTVVYQLEMIPTGKLVPIPRTDWPQLRDLFMGNDLAHEIPFNAVQNYIRWTTIDSKIRHLEILSLNDSWRQNGTFIILDRHELFFFSLEPSLKSLQEALELIDWDFPYRIFDILDQHQAVLRRVLEKLKVPYPRATVTCNVYRLSKEIGIELEAIPPDGLHLGPLDANHVKTINETWPFRNGGSEYALKRCIAWNTNVGLFDDQGEPVAWCLLNNLGIIAVLYTTEQYRRRGLAEVVHRSMIRQLAQRGMNAITTVLLENSASRALFEKLGFEGDFTVHDSFHQVNRLVEWNFF